MSFLNRTANVIKTRFIQKLFEKIIHLIDDERNDIFIHIDAKSRDFDKNLFADSVKHSEFSFVERADVFLGGCVSNSC